MDAHVSSVSNATQGSSPRILDLASARLISSRSLSTPEPLVRVFARRVQQEGALDLTQGDYKNADFAPHPEVVRRSEEHTSELQSRLHLVCRLLLEKKKQR